MTECPVCYRKIEPEDEAFTNPCFHRFCFECIDQWTDAQLRHPGASAPAGGGGGGGGGGGARQAPASCPVCRTPYSHIIFDADGVNFRLPPRAPDDPVVEAWLRRELQALLLEADVGVWVHQLLGVLRSCAAGGSAAGGGIGRGGGGSGAAARGAAGLERVERAARPVVSDHAPLFARQLWGFVQSGLTVAAHDAATFGECGGRAPKRRRAASPGRSSEGGGSPSAGGGGRGGGRGGDSGVAGDGGGGAGGWSSGSGEDDDAGGGGVWGAFGDDLATGEDY
ncbi:MAG: hypothetical protein J3K34DRAFT_524108 [Monoraphidium minutum]|nr:MAG: hypothetical protein J3K34DRAFT_524108 [Monoraphidium minutum]